MVAAGVEAGPYQGVTVRAPQGIIVVSPKVGWVEDGAYAASVTSLASGGSSTLRMPPAWAIRDGGMRHAVLNLGITEMVSVAADGFATPRDANLEAILAPAYAANRAGDRVTVHVRIHVGERAPAAWMTACGTVVLSDGSFAKKNPVPRWWGTAYRDMYEKAMRVAYAMCDARPIIGSVNSPMASLFYPEPFLLFKESVVDEETGATNQTNLVAAGFTAAAHRSFMLWAATIPGKYVRRCVAYLALNPTVFPTETSADMAFMWQVADAHTNALPAWQAGLENYSARMSYMTGSGNYQSMYAGICSRPVWRAIQMARPHRVADTEDGDTYCGWPDVADWWATLGGHAVETTGASGPPGGAANGWPDTYEPRTAEMRAVDAKFANRTNVTRTRT